MRRKIKTVKLTKDEIRRVEKAEDEIKHGKFCTFEDLKKGRKING